MFKNARSTRSSIPHSLQPFLVNISVMRKSAHEFCVFGKIENTKSERTFEIITFFKPQMVANCAELS